MKIDKTDMNIYIYIGGKKIAVSMTEYFRYLAMLENYKTITCQDGITLGDQVDHGGEVLIDLDDAIQLEDQANTIRASIHDGWELMSYAYPNITMKQYMMRYHDNMKNGLGRTLKQENK